MGTGELLGQPETMLSGWRGGGGEGGQGVTHTCDGLAPIQGGVAILLVASCFKKPTTYSVR